MQQKVDYLFLVAGIFFLMTLGYFFGQVTGMEFMYERVIWSKILVSNLLGQIVILLFSMIGGLGLIGISNIVFTLGAQMRLIVSHYYYIPIFKVIFTLAIHGIFEIATLAICGKIGLDSFISLVNYLFAEKRYNLKYPSAIHIFSIIVLLSIGSILEQYISYPIFEAWRFSHENF